MANSKISDLAAATTLADTDLLVIAQEDVSDKKVTWQTVRTQLRPSVFNVIDYGATGDGATNDTTAVQAAIDAAEAATPVGAVFFPSGTYMVDGLTVGMGANSQMPMIYGHGPEKSIISLRAIQTGPIVSVYAGVGNTGHHFVFRDLYLLANANDTATCLYLDNIDLSVISNVKTRNGAIGVDVDNCDASLFSKVITFNSLTAGIRIGANVGGHGTPTGNTYTDCFQYVTSSSRGDVAALVEWIAGFDHVFYGLRGYRTPGIAHKTTKGLYAHPSTLTSLYGYFSDCQWDGISTLSSDDSTCSPIYMVNAQHMRFSNCWTSGFSTTDATTNQAMFIDSCKMIDWTGGWISGRGVVFGSTSASDKCRFSNPLFSSANTTGMFIMPGSNPPTSLLIGGARREPGSTGQDVPISNNPTTLWASLDTRSDFFGYRPRNNKFSAATFYDEPDISSVSNNNSLTPTSGTIYCFALWLPSGLKITDVGFHSGSTALVQGSSPHVWAGIATSDNNIRALSADDTSPSWAANTAKTFTLSSPYVTPSDGRYYAVLMVNSGSGGTQPNLYSAVGLASLQGGGSIRRTFTADTGQTTPPALPYALTGLANISQQPYHWIT